METMTKHEKKAVCNWCNCKVSTYKKGKITVIEKGIVKGEKADIICLNCYYLETCI